MKMSFHKNIYIFYTRRKKIFYWESVSFILVMNFCFGIPFVCVTFAVSFGRYWRLLVVTCSKVFASGSNATALLRCDRWKIFQTKHFLKNEKHMQYKVIDLLSLLVYCKKKKLLYRESFNFCFQETVTFYSLS